MVSEAKVESAFKEWLRANGHYTISSKGDLCRALLYAFMSGAHWQETGETLKN